MSSISGEHLLELPIDQYQRYRVAADLIARLELSPSRSILDLGGAPGLLEEFLPNRDALVVDVSGVDPGGVAVGRGLRLPFSDRSFVVALALDTLEYVETTARGDLLAEMRRVSDVIVLSAAFAQRSVALAESALAEFVIQRFGDDFRAVTELSNRPLPDLEDTVAAVSADGWTTATLPSGYLPRWLGAMLLHHELLAKGIPELPRLNAFYNATLSPFDCREPAYRHVVLAARELPAERLESAVASLRINTDDEQGDVSVQLITAAVLAHGLGGSLQPTDPKELRAEIARLAQEVMRRDAQIGELRQSNRDLQAELQSTRGDVLREARRSISSVLLQRASDWRAKRRS